MIDNATQPTWRTNFDLVYQAALDRGAKGESLDQTSILDAAGVDAKDWYVAINKVKRASISEAEAYYALVGRKMRAVSGATRDHGNPDPQDDQDEEAEQTQDDEEIEEPDNDEAMLSDADVLKRVIDELAGCDKDMQLRIMRTAALFLEIELAPPAPALTSGYIKIKRAKQGRLPKPKRKYKKRRPQ